MINLIINIEGSTLFEKSKFLQYKSFNIHDAKVSTRYFFYARDVEI